MQNEVNGALAKMRHHRCSALPRELACPASHVEPDSQALIPLVDGGEEADLGSAVHEVLAWWIVHGKDLEKVHDAALHHGVGDVADEVAKISHMGFRLWQSLERFFPSAMAEVGLGPQHLGGSVLLTGHADMISIDAGERQLRILDWKSGYLDTDFTDQLKGYAWLALQMWPHIESVYACTVRIRAGEIDGHKWSREELDQWSAESAVKLERTGYNPGTHCRYCPRRLECPAIDAYLMKAANALFDYESDIERDPVADNLGYLLECVKTLEKVMEKARASIMAHVQAAGGMVDCNDGRELVVEEQERRKISASAKTKEILNNIGMLSEDEWLGTLTVGKGKVEDAVKSHAPRGSKVTAVKAVLDELDAAGQMSSTFFPKLEIRRKALPVTEVIK